MDNGPRLGSDMKPAMQPERARPPRSIRLRFPELYADLKQVAARLIAARPCQSQTPTDLSHAAFVRLKAEEGRRRDGRRSELGAKPTVDFKACFGAACRDVLADRARNSQRQKRGGDRQREPLHDTIALDPGDEVSAMEISDAIAVLEQLDARLAQLVEHRVFGGMTVDECAAALGTSTRTVDRKWAFARAWLRERLREV